MSDMLAGGFYLNGDPRDRITNQLPIREQRGDTMGVRISGEEKEPCTFLYDSTTGRPINTPAFEDAEQAEHFLRHVETKHDKDLRKLTGLQLDRERGLWHDIYFDEDGNFQPERA